ncbi:MAG: hypothetical protein GVY19_00010 [Bacteroidetes bacterium]|jgi:uncharacterized protein (TIGR02145 family)|nr:hypothetical protein [Bacteroidota bacterium]
MKKLNILIYLFIICSFTVAKAQDISLKEINASMNDSIVLRLNDYIGDIIQWQESTDSMNWSDISNANTDTLLVFVEQEKYIQALVTVGNCEPFISDIAIIIPGESFDYGAVTDIDGNTYKTIIIGDQEWMVENLRVTKYADGTPIPLITDRLEWSNLLNNNTDKAYCWYDNDRTANATKYGALYTWAAASYGLYTDYANTTPIQGACPDGWHIPSGEEWDILLEYVGDNGYNNDEGIALKSTSGWGKHTNEGNGDDAFGFKSLPAGMRRDVTNEGKGVFGHEGYYTEYWSSTVSGSHAQSFSLGWDDDKVDDFYNYKSDGHSVRCIKGQGILNTNSAPEQPSITKPENAATSQPLSDTLIWSCTDPEGDILTYDVYFDSIDATTLVSENQSDTIYLFEDLQINTTYYWKIVAKDGYGHETEGEVWSFTTRAYKYGSLTDIDGNTYKTVKIGNQEWMAENLKTTKYNDRTNIPLETSPIVWYSLTTPAYCWYDNDEATYKPDYGALYNWYVVETRKLCPDGWYVPSDKDWKQLEMYLGMGLEEADKRTSWRGTNEGLKIKEAGKTHWITNVHSTNESGFTALPGGHRNVQLGEFFEATYSGKWWSSTELNNTGWYRELSYNRNTIFRDNDDKGYGYSVRCIKGGGNSEPAQPSIQFPEINATNIPISDSLKWYCNDPDGDILTYDVYLDSIDATTLVSENQKESSYLFKDLKYNTKYYWKIIVKDGYANIVESAVWSFTTFADPYDSTMDIEGNLYKIVRIGNQWWFAENLKTTKYNDGSEIPFVTDTASTTHAYSWYNNNVVNNNIYGSLYNWHVIETEKLCPVGWHVPSDKEWQQLEMNLGMSEDDANDYNDRGTNEGGKMKVVGLSFWYSPNSGATNESGFSALPGGYHSHAGGFGELGYHGYWWTATERSGNSAWGRSLSYGSSSISRYYFGYYKNTGLAVRCVKD